MSDASKHPVRNSLLLGAASIAATFALAGAGGTLARKILPAEEPEPPETLEPETTTMEADAGAAVVLEAPQPVVADAAAIVVSADAGYVAARTVTSTTRSTPVVRRTTTRTTRVRTRSS